MDTRLVHLLLSVLIIECSVVPFSLNEFLVLVICLLDCVSVVLSPQVLFSNSIVSVNWSQHPFCSKVLYEC